MIHDIRDAKKAIIEQLERAGPLPKERLYRGSEFPASLITGAIARLESEREIRKTQRPSGQELYERVKPSLGRKLRNLFSR